MKRIANISHECVACGYCMKICPLRAISVPKGISAEIDENKCIGCGKCARACPAQVITIIERGKNDVKAKTVV
jgi:ferredoxin